MAKHKIFRKYFELLTTSPKGEAHGSAEYLFKCTEKEGFYSVSEPISEHNIIAFAKHKIDWINIELPKVAHRVRHREVPSKSLPPNLSAEPRSHRHKRQSTSYQAKLATTNMKEPSAIVKRGLPYS